MGTIPILKINTFIKMTSKTLAHLVPEKNRKPIESQIVRKSKVSQKESDYYDITWANNSIRKECR